MFIFSHQFVFRAVQRSRKIALNSPLISVALPWFLRRHLEFLRANRFSCDTNPIVARKVARKCENLRLNSLRDVRSIWRRKQCLSSRWTGLWYGEGKAKRPVDKHLGPPFHGTRCASDPDASSYWREHWLLTGLIDIGFSVSTYHAICSQSGNNKTLQTLLFKSYYQGRNYALELRDSHYP